MAWRSVLLRSFPLYVQNTFNKCAANFSTKLLFPKRNRSALFSLLGRGLLVSGAVGGVSWSLWKGSSHNWQVSAAEEPSLRSRLNFFATIAKTVSPAVVYLEIDEQIPTSIGLVHSRNNGSGFIVEENGLIMTNFHVVCGGRRRQKAMTVKMMDGTKFKGTVVATEPERDLALVQISAKNLPVLKFAKSSEAMPGEFVMAIGSPLNLSNTVTTGVISNTARSLSEIEMTQFDPNMRYIQTDVAITSGNSGGPLVNLDGEVVGVTSMTVAPVHGISFAIPSDYAKEFLEKAKSNLSSKPPKTESFFSGLTGRKKKPRYLGISMMALTPDVIRELQFSQWRFPNVTHGVLVHGVYLDSPAYKYGVEPGDIITHINDKPVKNPADVFKVLEETDTVTLGMVREGRTTSLTVQMDEN